MNSDALNLLTEIRDNVSGGITGGGGGGGGTGDASAANQTTQIARETSIRDQIGALTTPAAGSTNAQLASANTALGNTNTKLDGVNTRLDTANTASGATNDATYTDSTGASAGSHVALLKGAFVRMFGLGTPADTTATTDTGSFTLIALTKRSLGYLSTIATAVGGNLTTKRSQGTIAHTKITLVAATATNILASGTYNGARILNWTASPVYIMPGTSGTPASGAPSDYIPAAASGVPGQYEPPYYPNSGLQAIGASAGDLTVETY